MVTTPTKLLTLAEFLQLPETKPASEYMDGQILQKPMPQGKHSTIQGELVSAINTVLRPQCIARAFPELRCIFDGRAIVPDVSVFVWERIARDSNGEIANIFQSAPDWIVEVLSPEQSSMKVIKKILRCLENGTQIGWLVDPSDKTVFVYLPQQQTQVFETLEQKILTPSFAAGFELTVGKLFAWLLD